MTSWEIPSLIMIGGSSRNVGKTTLANRLIKKYSPHYPVIGLKVTSIYPGEKNYHGHHKTELEKDFEIFEEKNKDGYKDTCKMLYHGASRVFYIRAHDYAIKNAFQQFMEFIPGNAVMVCESISLRLFVKPGLFILIESTVNPAMKISFGKLLPYADLLIKSDGKNFDFDVDRIVFENGHWIIRS